MLSRRSLLAGAAALTVFSLPLAAQDATATIRIDDAYGRAMGGVGKSGAVFFDIVNSGAAADRLLAVTSDVAARVELHTHKEDANGVMQMVHVTEGFAVPAGGSHSLARGGDHVMLLGLTRDLAQGDRFTLVLSFEVAGDVTVEVAIDNDRKPAKNEPCDCHTEGHMHNHGG